MFLKILETKKKSPMSNIRPSGSRTGIIYGSAKVHKIVTDGLPSFRPILSATGKPTYKLVKFLVPMLECLTINEFTVRDSFTFDII